MADTSLVYPAPAVQDAALQYVKAIVPVGFATTVNVFTTARGSRFFVTSLVLHDPQPTGAVGSVSIAFGSASTPTTSLTQVIDLRLLNGLTTSQFLQVSPGLANGGTQGGVTTSVTYAGQFSPAWALGGGDCVQAFVTVAGTATATMQVDIVGYYI